MAFEAIALAVDQVSKSSHESQTFSLADENASQRLRVVVTVDGQSPEVAWQSFLDQYFDDFDLDASRTLNMAEVERLLALPKVAGESPAVDFARLDTDRDGSVTKQEWKHHCRAHEYTGIVGAKLLPSEEDRRLGEIFWDSLDVDENGTIDQKELSSASRLLGRHDLNDDEYLDRSELLNNQTTATRPTWTGVVNDTEEAADVALHVALGVKPSVSLPTSARSSDCELRHPTAEQFQLIDAQRRFIVIGSNVRRRPNVRSSSEFIVAQFQAALGEQKAISKANMESDPTLGSLVEIFAVANRNQVQELSLAELRSYLALIESGLNAQVCIKLSDHGRNLFPVLDADQDGRLSCLEIAAARDLPALGSAAAQMKVYRLEFGALPLRSWGGIAIPVVKPPRPSPMQQQGPRWFTSLDRNRDGVVSPREFLGPLAVFRQFDKNRNGLIQPDEAFSAATSLQD